MSWSPPPWLRWSLGVAALVVGLAAAWLTFGRPPDNLTHPGPDLAPLWLGGWAMWKGLDPADPAIQQWLWDQRGSGLRPGQFFMPYPTTAALLAMPLAYLPWDQLAGPMWVASAAALVLAALVSPGLAGRRLRAPGWLLAAGVGLAGIAGLDVVHHSLQIGQINAVVVCLTVVGAALLARDRPVAAGAVLAVGVGLKLFPGVVLLAAVARRQWRALASAAVVGAVIAAATVWVHPGWNPVDDVSRAWIQITIGQAHRDPPLWGLWRFRVVPFGLLTMGMLFAVRKRSGEADPERRGAAAVAVALALGAGEAGGLAPPHEILLIAPALLALVAPVGSWRLAAALTGGLLVGAVLSPLDRYPQSDLFSQDHGLWLIVAIWVLAGVRVFAATRE